MRQAGCRFISLIVGVAVMSLASASPAITPIKRSFSELVSQAEFIVVGTISQMQSLRLPDGAIVTDLTLGILESMKGDTLPGSILTLRMLGGTVGDTQLLVAGAPQFRPGQTVLLFVRGNTREMFPFVGVQQGVFHVGPAEPPGAAHVLDWLGQPVTGIRDDEVLVDPGGAETTAISVDEFLREIQRRLGP